MKNRPHVLRRAAQGSVLFAAILPVTQAVAAPITYDLRFADGSHIKSAIPGLYTADLWVVVRGNDGSNINEGMQSCLVTIMSKQTFGGSIAAGGITSAVVSADFQSFSGTSPLHRTGSAGNLNADGVTDWGSTSTSAANTNYFWCRSPAMTAGGGGVGNAVDANAWEFKIGTFTIKIDALTLNPAGATAFNIVKPSAIQTPTPALYVIGQVDGAHFNVVSNNQQGAYTGSVGITFIPEPAAAALTAIAALRLLHRTRPRHRPRPRPRG
jgi:hypothetical protein